MGELVEVPLRCPRCGKRGDTVWEREGDKLAIVATSDRFYARIRRGGLYYQTELACLKCKVAVPPPSQEKSTLHDT